jgi:hypothetical protein
LIFLLTGLGAAASAVLIKKNPAGVMLGGCLALIGGAAVTFASIETSMSAVLFVGTAIAGVGFGSAFMGAYRATVALDPSDDRAGVITAIYIVSYLATGVPAVIGGIATSHFCLHRTALVYSVAVAALAAAGVSLLVHRMAAGRAQRGTHPPGAPLGPGTVPPCPPIGPRPPEGKA